jgi:protein-arginine kinase activator protein McsA
LEGLRARLEKAVEGEAFEEAATLRDQIRGLE